MAAVIRLVLLVVLLVAGAGRQVKGGAMGPCDGNPCQNGGACADGPSTPEGAIIAGSGYCCFCTQGYSGVTCGTTDSAAANCAQCEDGTGLGWVSDGMATPYCACGGGANTTGVTDCLPPTTTPPPTGGTSSESKTCFPGRAQVRRRLTARRGAPTSGQQPAGPPAGSSGTAMARINIGDKVLGLDETDMTYKYSPVFMFGHRSPRTRAVYRRLRTRRGVALTASPGHLVWRRKAEMPAAGAEGDNDVMMSLVEMRDILVGDLVLVSLGSDMVAGNSSSGGTQWEPVVGTEQMMDIGLYNPHTLTGNMLVDGVLASCYSHIVPHAPLAHAILWAPRQLYNIMPIKWMQYQQHYIVDPIIEVIASF